MTVSDEDVDVVFIGEVDPATLQQDLENANLGTERGDYMLDQSLDTYGAGRSIVLDKNGIAIAGNKTLEKAVEKGFKIAVVETDGKTLIAVRRRDFDAIEDPELARGYAFADNRVGEVNLRWDKARIVSGYGNYKQVKLFWKPIEIDSVKYQLQHPGSSLERDASGEDAPTTQVASGPEYVPVVDLKPHPRDYRTYPPDQIEHVAQLIREFGFYRPVAVARENTILAGGDIAQAALVAGKRECPVIRHDLDPDDPQALKLLAADQEVAHLAERDDRALTHLLKEIKETNSSGLAGTGYDDQMLANLVMVTRPASEVRDCDEAAEWVGMPEYEGTVKPAKAIVSFETEEDAADFFARLDIDPNGSGVRTTSSGSDAKKTHSLWWPVRDLEDPSSLRFTP